MLLPLFAVTTIIQVLTNVTFVSAHCLGIHRHTPPHQCHQECVPSRAILCHSASTPASTLAHSHHSWRESTSRALAVGRKEAWEQIGLLPASHGVSAPSSLRFNCQRWSFHKACSRSGAAQSTIHLLRRAGPGQTTAEHISVPSHSLASGERAWHQACCCPGRRKAPLAPSLLLPLLQEAAPHTPRHNALEEGPYFERHYFYLARSCYSLQTPGYAGAEERRAKCFNDAHTAWSKPKWINNATPGQLAHTLPITRRLWAKCH